MGAKATGAELQSFYEEWPPGDDWYNDDTSIETHSEAGDWMLDPRTRYDLDDFGTINWQGDHRKTPNDNCINFGAWFKKWKKQRSTSMAVVTVQKDDLADLLAICKDRKWTVQVS